MSLIEKLKSEIEQRNNKPFLKAAMAVCALVANADGTVTFAERYRVDRVLETVRELRIYDPHKAVDLLDEFLDDLRRDREQVDRILRAKIARFAADHKSARTLLRIAYFILTADEGISAAERTAFDRICQSLNVDPRDVFDKMAAAQAA